MMVRPRGRSDMMLHIHTLLSIPSPEDAPIHPPVSIDKLSRLPPNFSSQGTMVTRVSQFSNLGGGIQLFHQLYCSTLFSPLVTTMIFICFDSSARDHVCKSSPSGVDCNMIQCNVAPGCIAARLDAEQLSLP